MANRYSELLSDIPLKLPFQLENLFVISLIYNSDSKNGDHLGHKWVFDYMRTNKIGVNLHYIPVYRHPYYQKLGFPERYCKNAEAYA